MSVAWAAGDFNTEGTEGAESYLEIRIGEWGSDILFEMVELTQLQMETVERLFAAGFRPIAIPPYESALCVHRGECAALLAPVTNGGLRLLAPATYLVEGNLSVKLKRGKGEVFVWKQQELAATAERLAELERFREELVGILESGKL